MRRFLPIPLAFLLLAAGCGSSGDDEPAAGGSASPTPGSEATPLPTLANSQGSATPPASVLNAIRTTLANRTSTTAANITVVSVEPKTWPDGCLGLGTADMACTQALVPGWLITLRTPDGKEHRYRAGPASFVPEP